MKGYVHGAIVAVGTIGALEVVKSFMGREVSMAAALTLLVWCVWELAKAPE